MVSTPDGRYVQIEHTPVSDGGWLATHEDITERKLSDARIAHLAHYDALTDLPNRTLFRERLESELAVNGEEKIAVLYIDIDEFKSINDSLGHPVGDELLKAISARLSNCIGPRDFVARLGGDEFAIVQVGIAHRDEAAALVSRVYKEVRQSLDCLGHRLSTDASIGIAIAPDDGTALDQLLKHADLAMYAAKASGRRTYRFFESDMNARMKDRRALELDLREAISEGRLELHYQPSVSTKDNSIIGCEALVRWHHPERGLISPVDFIPIAEQAGLIDQLGEWVLRAACREAATWPDQIKIAVNVSPIQFKTRTFPLKVASALTASGLSANRLEIEVTEAVLIDDDDVALDILHQLRGMGVRIALDDFGTGYSSLSYLQRFPFDKIKIDRCFVRDITEPEGSLSIVQAVVNIAGSRCMTTTAEGVETEPQLEVLRKLGCDEMQGYLFSAAKAAEDIRKLFLSAPLAKQLSAA